MAKPFLKWAGGKGQLIEQIELRLQSLKITECTTYIEPFLGGGAVLFHILENYNFENFFVFDINPELIMSYQVVKHKSSELINALRPFQVRYSKSDEKTRKKMFYKIREDWNKQILRIDNEAIANWWDYSLSVEDGWELYKIECASYPKNNRNLDWFREKFALDLRFNGTSKRWVNRDKFCIKRVSQMIFLNRTCFNGLYRVNSLGRFNVPKGKYKNPKILDKENLISVSKSLQKVSISCNSFENSLKNSSASSFTYIDPPYRPVGNTSDFTSYSKEGFGDKQQLLLAELCRGVMGKGGRILLSNSYNDDDYYSTQFPHCKIDLVLAKRNINSDPKGRKPVYEVMIYNDPNDFIS